MMSKKHGASKPRNTPLFESNNDRYLTLINATLPIEKVTFNGFM